MRHRSPRWRALGLALLGLALTLLSACGAAGNTPSYNTGAGQIVAQLFSQPGFVASGLIAVPTWTLYGDGTVISRSGPIGGPATTLTRGTLSQSAINHLLDTIVNQDHFLDASKPSYGHAIPDTGSTRLTVNANGKSKSVTLLGAPDANADQETEHVFAVENALLSEHPADAAPYAAPGAALLVFDRTPTSAASGTAWPYADVDLSQAYGVSCGVMQHTPDCPSAAPNAKFYGVYGGRAHDVLGLLNGASLQAQQGEFVYTVVAYPLMPDALVAQNGHAAGVLVNGAGRIGLQPQPPSQ